MRRALRILLGVGVIVVALLVVNAIVLDNQTGPAGVTVEGGQLIDVSDVQLQYVDRPPTGRGGEGPPIVLLHCFTCSLQWWDPMIAQLNVHHRVVAFDLIGHGGSEKPSSGYEIETQSGAIAAALNQLGVRGATIVGHSMGGLVATSLAEQASDLADRVVLIGVPSEPGQADLPFTAKAATAPLIEEAIWRLKLDSMVRSSYGDSFAPGADVEKLFSDPNRVVEDIDAMTFKSFDASERENDAFLEAESVASRLRTLGIPVLAIDGAEDQILDASEVLSGYRAIPGARIVTVQGAGHSPNVEKPKVVGSEILRFARPVFLGSPGRTVPKATPSESKKRTGGGRGRDGPRAKSGKRNGGRKP